MPDARNDEFVTNETSGVVGNLFADNGSGTDFDPGAIIAVNGNAAGVGTQITLASGALLTVNSDGSFAYDPNGAFEYTPTFASGAFNTPSADSFSYTIANGDTATVIFTIDGIDNDDTVIGSEDNNRLIGRTGNDTVFGLGGVDYITGGFGDDMIFGDDGIDRAGWYQINEALGGATVSLLLQGTPQDTGSQGWDTLFDIENLSGTPFADSLTGDDNDNWLWGSPATIAVNWISTSNNDYLDGQGGNDLLVVGIGNHTVIGGDGADTLRFTENGSPEPAISVDLNLQGGAQDTGAGIWTLSGIENLSGGIGDDTLIGDGIGNLLAGNVGGDVLNGGGGNDLLLGDGFVNVNADGVSAITYDQGTIGGNDQLTGGGGDDAMYGGGGNDVLRGNIGNDDMHGGSGDDLLVGGLGDDIVDGGDGYDRAGNYHLDEALGGVTIDLNLQGVAQNTGSQGWDTLIGIEYVSGTPWADTLTGDGNDNVLWGSAATIDPETNWISTSNNDTLDGGAGNDLLYVGIGNHSLTGGSGIDTVGFTEIWGDDPAISVSLALQGSAQDTGQGLWTLNGIENLSGGNDDDTLSGDGNANILGGHSGNDMLSGGGGDDSLYGDGSIDTGSPTSGPPTLFPDIGANGNDILEGGLGNDLIDGGGGIDTATYAQATGAVTVNLNSGTSSGADGNDTLVNIENLRGSEFNDTLTGNTGANLIDGLGGNDTINGHSGDDVIFGGDGNDFLLGDLGENNLSVSGNDIIDGGAGNDILRGGLGNDQLYGGDGNDLMRGNGGVDYFDGGANDPFSDTNTGDRVSFFDQRITQGVVADLRTGIIANDGYGNVETMVNIESLGSGSAYADTFHGNDDRNYLAADVGDQVYGYGGDDFFQSTSAAAMVDGGSGYDRLFLYASASFLLPDANGDGLAEFAGPATSGYVVDLAAGTITDGYGNSGDVAGIEEVWGSELGDTIIGNGSGNVLNGQAGNDLIEGGGGDDTIDGGDGNDTASYANALGGVEVFLYRLGTGNGESAGADGFDLLANIENLTGSSFNDFLGGNNLVNVLTGGDGNDSLRGQGGDDTLLGGGGNDFLNGGLGDDIIDGGAGFDRAAFYADAGPAGVTVDLNLQGVAQDTGQGMDTLVGIENVSGSIYGDHLSGDEGDNQLWGSASTLLDGTIVTTNNDVLSGNGGNDLLVVGIGNHVVDGGSGIDTFRFTENGAPETGITLSLLLQGAAQASGNGDWTLTGIENLSGSISSDNLTGDGNANVLAGDLGDDVLNGGGGNDTLYGDGAIVVDGPGSGPIVTYPDLVATFGGVSGNDVLDGGSGDDQLYGGGGNDTASYASAGGNVSVFLYNGGFGEAVGAAGYDQLHDIENVIGSAFNDILYGNNVDNVVTGGDGHDDVRGGTGNDQVYGDAGDDLLYGNSGDDLLDGGAGSDRVGYYSGATAGVTVNLNLQGVAQDTGQGWDTLINIENVSGTQFGDTLIGDDNDNWLWGSASTIAPGNIVTTNNDTLSGGGGNDLMILGIGNHVVDGGTGIDTFRFNENGAPETGITLSLLLQGTAQVSGNGDWTLTNIENLSGSIANDSLTGDGNANLLAGDLGDDTLVGGGGNDTLYGDGQISWDGHGTGRSGPITTYVDATGQYVGGVAGNDTLEGGLGNDILDGGGGIDTASYANAGGSVTVNLGSGTSSGADGNDTLANFENIVGSAFNDTLVGNNSANVLDGGDGIDTIAAFAGNDTLNGGSGNDNLYGMQGNDTLNGGEGNDNLRGGTGDDLIDGGSGFNLAGYFAILTDTVANGVTVDLNLQGVAQNTGQGWDTLVNIQGLAGTQFADLMIGDGNTNLFVMAGAGAGAPGGNDQVFGNGGDDLLVVGSGDVMLDGGTGNDTISFNAAGGTLLNGVTVSLALQGAAQTTGSGSMTLVGIEHLSGTGLADTLTGDGGNNDLSGAGGDDVLVGGAGNDNLRGDAVFTAFSPTDGTILSPYLAGDASVFAGQVSGNDTLEGGLGNDLLDGGAGTDTATYLNAAGGVTVNLAGGSATGADGSDTLVNIENATGGAFNDTLTGNNSANALAGGDGHDSLSGAGGDDTLQGGNGNDNLTGGAGDDLLDGGAGFDRASYNVGATAGVTVNLSLSGAQNTGQGFDTLVNVEHVVGTTFNDVITGNATDNWLWGGSLGTGVTGNDTISGGDGNDLVEVGTGNHTLSGGNGTGDTLSFWAGGTDVTSTGVAFNLATTGAQNTRQGTMTANGFENLSGSRYGDILTGDSNNNILAGGTGNDTLNGGIGADTLYGDGQYTTFTAGGLPTGPIRLVADITTEFGGVAGADNLNGGDGDDFLYGGGGNDVLKGDRDNDTLYGGTGNDTLVGGQGNDRYVIEANSGADTISGFAHVDNIVFAASSGVTSFSQLTLTKVGGTSTLVTWGNGNSILIDMKPSDLTAADFSFEAGSMSLSMAASPSSSPDYFFG